MAAGVFASVLLVEAQKIPPRLHDECSCALLRDLVQNRMKEPNEEQDVQPLNVACAQPAMVNEITDDEDLQLLSGQRKLTSIKPMF